MPSKTTETFGKRVALEARRSDLLVLVGVMIADGFIVKQGDVIGKISASGEYRRRARATVNTTAFATNSPTGKVLDASVFAADDVLTNEDGDNVGTIESIDLTTTPHTLTLTGNAAVAVAAGADVLGSDGSQIAQGISDSETDGTEAVSVPVIIGGYLDESKLRGLDSTAKTELAGASVAGGVFKF
ncbi:MAG: hypothetical protein WBV94_04480 [Blastocatellia bacterium]